LLTWPLRLTDSPVALVLVPNAKPPVPLRCHRARFDGHALKRRPLSSPMRNNAMATTGSTWTRHADRVFSDDAKRVRLTPRHTWRRRSAIGRTRSMPQSLTRVCAFEHTCVAESLVHSRSAATGRAWRLRRRRWREIRRFNTTASADVNLRRNGSRVE
jgi:hypothetical protein